MNFTITSGDLRKQLKRQSNLFCAPHDFDGLFKIYLVRVVCRLLFESWSDEDASQKARLFVRWGMFPTWQEYLTGEYSWGLTAYDIPPGAQFDLDVYWNEGDKQYTGTINDIICAPDIDSLK